MPRNGLLGACCFKGSDRARACNPGTIGSSGITTLSMTALTTDAGSCSITTTSASELPDPVAANNSASTSTTVIAGPGSGDSDVPTLPQWAMILLMLVLGAVAMWQGVAVTARFPLRGP
jgi:IPTL-CTERM motif